MSPADDHAIAPYRAGSKEHRRNQARVYSGAPRRSRALYLAQNNPVVQAIEEESVSKLRDLIAKGENLRKEHVFSHGKAPALHMAAAINRRKHVVKFLLEQGHFRVDDETINDKMTALHWAARCNPSTKTARYLLQNGASIDALDANGCTPLHQAAKRNPLETMIEALLRAGARVDAQDSRGQTSLMHAVQRKAVARPVIGALLEEGADVDLADTDGRTALHHAVRAKKGDLPSEFAIRLLLEKNAYVDSKDSDGWTPLQHAAHRLSCPDWLCPLLLAYKADVRARNASGETPLHSAARNSRSEELVHALAKAGAEVNALDNDGYSPVHLAAWVNPTVSILETLLKLGGQANLMSHEDRYTPLHLACLLQDPQVAVAKVRLLLAYGAGTGLRDGQGRTPADLTELEDVRRLVQVQADCPPLEVREKKRQKRRHTLLSIPNFRSQTLERSLEKSSREQEDAMDSGSKALLHGNVTYKSIHRSIWESYPRQQRALETVLDSWTEKLPAKKDKKSKRSAAALDWLSPLLESVPEPVRPAFVVRLQERRPEMLTEAVLLAIRQRREEDKVWLGLIQCLSRDSLRAVLSELARGDDATESIGWLSQNGAHLGQILVSLPGDDKDSRLVLDAVHRTCRDNDALSRLVDAIHSWGDTKGPEEFKLFQRVPFTNPAVLPPSSASLGSKKPVVDLQRVVRKELFECSYLDEHRVLQDLDLHSIHMNSRHSESPLKLKALLQVAKSLDAGLKKDLSWLQPSLELTGSLAENTHLGPVAEAHVLLRFEAFREEHFSSTESTFEVRLSREGRNMIKKRLVQNKDRLNHEGWATYLTEVVLGMIRTLALPEDLTFGSWNHKRCHYCQREKTERGFPSHCKDCLPPLTLSEPGMRLLFRWGQPQKEVCSLHITPVVPHSEVVAKLYTQTYKALEKGNGDGRMNESLRRMSSDTELPSKLAPVTEPFVFFPSPRFLIQADQGREHLRDEAVRQAYIHLKALRQICGLAGEVDDNQLKNVLKKKSVVKVIKKRADPGKILVVVLREAELEPHFSRKLDYGKLQDLAKAQHREQLNIHFK